MPAFDIDLEPAQLEFKPTTTTFLLGLTDAEAEVMADSLPPLFNAACETDQTRPKIMVVKTITSRKAEKLRDIVMVGTILILASIFALVAGLVTRDWTVGLTVFMTWIPLLSTMKEMIRK